jgi:di/tricarboxylate transporter
MPKSFSPIPWNILLLSWGAMSVNCSLHDTKTAERMVVSWISWFQITPHLIFVLAIAISVTISLFIATHLSVAPHVIFFTSLKTVCMPFNLQISASPNAIAFESMQFTAKEFFLYGCVPSSIFMVLLAPFCYFIWPRRCCSNILSTVRRGRRFDRPFP